MARATSEKRSGGPAFALPSSPDGPERQRPLCLLPAAVPSELAPRERPTARTGRGRLGGCPRPTQGAFRARRPPHYQHLLGHRERPIAASSAATAAAPLTGRPSAQASGTQNGGSLSGPAHRVRRNPRSRCSLLLTQDTTELFR